MSKGIVLFVSLWALIGLSEGVGTTAGHFCYNKAECDESSDLWPGLCKNGTKQSPIDLESGTTAISRMITPVTGKALRFNGNYKNTSFYIINNGHTVQVQLTPDPTSSAEMTGDGLNGPYVLGQMHFHWGKGGHQGSEHTVGGVKYDMEMHLVHYRKDLGSITAAAATGSQDALAVVGVFLQTSMLDPLVSMTAADRAFQAIVKNIPVKENAPGALVNSAIDLTPFLPKAGAQFYRYNGSLTTPNCAEVVIWSVVKEPMYITRADDEAFQGVHDDEDENIETNDRNVQKANGRKVETHKAT